MSPISKYFDTQRIDKVEASAGAVIGGLGVLYIICHTLGYDIGTIHAPTIKEEVVKFATDLHKDNSITTFELMDINVLLASDKFAETIALKTIITKLYEVVSSYLESKEYDETSGVHQLAQDRYTYNHLPRTYDTVAYSQKYNNATASKGYTRIITAYDDNTDCYYSMSFSNVRDNEYIAVLNDGLFYLTFDSSDNLEYIYDFNTDNVHGWKNDGSSYSDYTKDFYNASLSITGSQFADIIRSGYQIYSDRFLGIINTSSRNLVRGTDTISTIQSKRISDYSVPSDLDIIRHGVTDVTFPERIVNSGYDLTTSQASAIANAYSEAYSSSTGQSISARYPTTDRTKVEDNIIADVYPVVDRTFSDTNSGENTDTNEGTDVGTDTETEELDGLGILAWLKKIWQELVSHSSFLTSISTMFEAIHSEVVSNGLSLDTLNDTLVTNKNMIVGAIATNIQQVLPNILVIEFGSRLDALNDTLEQTVVGALANIGVYDIDIWDTVKDILDNMFTIDALTDAFGIDKIHTNSDLVISGLGSLDGILSDVRTGVADLVTDITNLFGNISLTDIFYAILTLPSNIALELLTALGSLLETLFIPDTVALEATLNEFGGKFPWIPKLFGYTKNIRGTLQSSTVPPAVYVDFRNSENSNYHPIGKVKVLDVSWYAQYKPNFDLYMSGFLWLFFIWKVLKNLPNIISGGGMVVEDHAQYEYQQAKNFGSAKNGKFRKG